MSPSKPVAGDDTGDTGTSTASDESTPNWGMGRTGNSLRPFRTIQVRL
jgi:hypothetical protein